MNHRAIIFHPDYRFTVIAGGSKKHCRQALKRWIKTHPVHRNDEPIVLKEIWTP